MAHLLANPLQPYYFTSRFANPLLRTGSEFETEILLRIHMLYQANSITLKRLSQLSGSESQAHRSKEGEVNRWRKLAYQRLANAVDKAFEAAQIVEDTIAIKDAIKVLSRTLEDPFAGLLSFKSIIALDGKSSEWSSDEKKRYLGDKYWERRFADLIKRKGWKNMSQDLNSACGLPCCN